MSNKKSKNRRPRRPSVDTVRHRQIKFRLSESEYQALRKKMSQCKMTQQKYLVKCVRKAPIYDLSEVREILPALMDCRNLLMQISRTSDAEEVKQAMTTVDETWGQLNKILRKNNCTK